MSKEKENQETQTLGGLSMENVLNSYVNPEETPETPEEPEVPETPENPEEPETPEEKPKEPEAKKQSGVKKEGEEKPKEGEEAPETESVLKKIVAQYGFEDINADEFEETEEGLIQLNGVIAEKLAEQEIEGFFESYPAARSYFEYLALGGDPDKYHSVKNPEIDYSEVNIVGDESIQKTVIRKWLESQNYTKEEVDSELEDYDNAGMLEKKAKMAIGKLQTKQEQDKKELIENQRKEAQEKATKVKEYWTGVWDKLDKSATMKNLNIPVSEKKALFDYMSKPVTKEGYSQEQLDEMEMKKDPEARIALALIKMKKFNLSKYVDNVAKTNQAKSLSEKLGKGLQKAKAATNKETPNLENPDIANIQGINFGNQLA